MTTSLAYDVDTGRWLPDTVATDTAGNATRLTTLTQPLTPTSATFTRVIASSNGVLRVGEAGDSLGEVADITLNTSNSTQLVGTNNNRTSLWVQNIDSSDNVRVGGSNVSATRGIRLAPGERVELKTRDAVRAIAESGTPSVAIIGINQI